MKEITREQFEELFYFPDDEIEQTVLESDPEDLTFYDSGAVKNSEGDFIVKMDQVKRRVQQDPDHLNPAEGGNRASDDCW